MSRPTEEELAAQARYERHEELLAIIQGCTKALIVAVLVATEHDKDWAQERADEWVEDNTP